MLTKYQKKLLDAQFQSISYGWLESALQWCINSKYRKYKSVSKFLRDQLDFPDKDVKDLALKLRGKDPYVTVSRAEEFVIRNFTYKTDKAQFNMPEYWAEAGETFNLKADDCEGLNSLIWLLCVMAGIPEDMIYCCLGEVKGGYHHWCLFFDAKRNRMVRLDAAYFPNVSTIAKKPAFKLGTDYKRIDYAFNSTNVFKMK